jgi:hypothetical protein
MCWQSATLPGHHIPLSKIAKRVGVLQSLQKPIIVIPTLHAFSLAVKRRKPD